MKWLTTTIVAAALALATNSCATGQDVINFVLDQEDAKGIRGQQLIKSSRSKFEFENEEVLAGSTPPLLLLPKKTLDEKPESIGVLSNDKKSITSVDDPQDQTVLSVSQPQDVDSRQSHLAQERRLDAATFLTRCDATTPPSLSGSNSYVVCDAGLVSGTSTSCAAACGGLCCTGTSACDGFTGLVCKDGSCGNERSCNGANIDYVVGPSCTNLQSCTGAITIGSVDSSCNNVASCIDAQLSGVDLINSCNGFLGCSGANGNGAFIELNDCCNDQDQCKEKVGADIVAVGGPSCLALTSMPTSVPSFVPSEAPSQSSAPSDEPSGLPSISVEPSQVPSAVPSESGKPSTVPSFVPSQSSEPSTEPSDSPSISVEPSEVPSFVPSQSSAPSDAPSVSGKPSFVPSNSPSTSVEPSSSPSENNSKGGKGSSKASKNEKSGKGKSSKVDSSNMASKSELLAYLSSIDLTPDEKKALILILIIGILERLTGDANEMD